MDLRIGATGVRVLQLQGELRQLVDLSLAVDGEFGPRTDAALRRYQRECALTVDGWAGEITLAALQADMRARHVRELQGFRGRLGVLVALESFEPGVYVPGGALDDNWSGVTCGYGLDLGHQDADTIRALLSPIFLEPELSVLVRCAGLKGGDARKRLETDPALRRIRFTRSQAASLLAYTVVPYWQALTKRFPAILDPSAPPGLHSALLSLCVHAWVDDVAPLRRAIEARDWDLVQHQHALLTPRFRTRRAREAALIELA